MYYENIADGELPRLMPHTLEMDYFTLWSSVTPAWSLHRLMEMAFNSLNDADADDEDEIYFVRKVNPYESMLESFEWLIKEGYFNKEYLV